MPATHERLPNKPLSGHELCKIMVKDVENILNKDGFLNSMVAFPRVSYSIRVAIHMDNPIYPEHVSEIESARASKQQVAANPELGALETAPLSEPENEFVFAEERERTITSPNMARIENDMPISFEKKNMDTGQIETKQITYDGDKPDPGQFGNTVKDKPSVEIIEDQRQKWSKRGKR